MKALLAFINKYSGSSKRPIIFCALSAGISYVLMLPVINLAIGANGESLDIRLFVLLLTSSALYI